MRRAERGKISRSKLDAVETTFRKRLDGLVKSVNWVPEYDAGLEELQIELWDGIRADESRFDVAWWERHGYKYHYVESGAGPETDKNGTNADRLQFRFGWEKRPGVPDKHFHPPEDLDAHRESCIRHEDVTRVTLAVVKCWHAAATAGDPAKLNALADPPCVRELGLTAGPRALVFSQLNALRFQLLLELRSAVQHRHALGLGVVQFRLAGAVARDGCLAARLYGVGGPQRSSCSGYSSQS